MGDTGPSPATSAGLRGEPTRDRAGDRPGLPGCHRPVRWSRAWQANHGRSGVSSGTGCGGGVRAANPPPESPAAEELAGALHDELADALDQARARLAAGDVPEVDRPAHQAQIELFEAELAGDEAIPKQLARGGGDPVLAGKTAAWLAAEAAATQRWIAADAVAGAHQAVADTQRLHAQRAERWPAANWLAADDHAGIVGDEVELGSHDEALPPV